MERGLVDLHRHLDGSLRWETLAALSPDRDLPGPAELAFRPGMGLAGALSRFEITLRALQTPSAVRRVASEICEDAASEGVTTLEIRFAPQLHQGASPEAIVDAAAEGAAGRAGLVLCGLYGEPPAILERLVAAARTRPAVVGIDLAGGPTLGHAFHLQDYAPAFRSAVELGLGRTVHAGEGRPAAEIRTAIESLGAERIGHGTTLLDDPELVDLVVEKGITIEACPTSNLHTGVIESVAVHPLPRWLARGVRVCVNTDNTLFSQTDAAQELARVAEIPGMTEGWLREIVRFGHSAAFAHRGA